MIKFRSTKTYTHAEGLSCAFRQWRADSHCRFLHGYALQVKLTFEGDLDERNWVVDFGGLKGIKEWLKSTFDHKTIVARDDPHAEWYREGARLGTMDLTWMDKTGCEAFAYFILNYTRQYIYTVICRPSADQKCRVQCMSVEVNEHEGNSAIAYWDDWLERRRG